MIERRRLFVIAAVVAALTALPSSALAARKPATFNVGAATASIAPNVPVFAGGFGRYDALTAAQQHDPLQVKAFYVERNGKAAAFAIVDCQAWFAEYQGDLSGLGIAAARADAAKAVGHGLSADAIIVQGTHSHAAATLEGIWGPTPPAYLKLVHDQTVAAIAQAARTARAAHLQWATVKAPYLNNIDTAQTDSYAGWSQDPQMSVLRAVAPSTGETLATFVNVPAHPDIVNGGGLKQLSADYFGHVRATLEDRLGGTSVVGGATLGREETPVQTDGLGAMEWFGGVVDELATRALGKARWITDGTLAATSQHILVPGTNPALLALVEANHLPDDVKEQEAGTSDIYPINRADTPPWLYGNTIGTDLTAVRIGPLAYVSMPGESFPEVRIAIAKATKDAAAVIALAKGQDDLGYFFPAWAYPFTFVYDSDHWTYNVAVQMGDEAVEGQILNLQNLGFKSNLTFAGPLPTRFEQALAPGLQAMASPARGDAGPDGTFAPTFEAVFESAAYNGSDLDGLVHWDFGDGTKADTKPTTRFTHAYAPGAYTAVATAHDTAGHEARWEVPVRIYPRLVARIAEHGKRLVARVSGGRSPVLAYRWDLGNGETASGPSIAAPADPSAVTLRVTDATGTVVTATGE